jgi:EmrB/QacA subfamily drug resistance transporter
MKPPCDEIALRAPAVDSPCAAQAAPWILAATILGSSMAFIDSTIVNVALPALQASFHASIFDLQWVVESYALFLGALILVGGSTGDLFGRRRIFVAGVALFAIASAACGLAQSVNQLILARAIQGIGAAFLVPGSLAIISASFPEKDRGRAIGTWSGFTAITMAFGPVLGGWLIEHVSWRWAFYINLPLAAAVILISLWRVPESRSSTAKRLDRLGALIVTVGLGCLVYGLIESARLGWHNPRVMGSLFVGAASLAAFPFIETRTDSPMVTLKLFHSRAFTGANLLTLWMYSAIGIFFFVFPMNLIQVQHYSATAAGAASLPLILLVFFLSRWSGGLVTHYGPRLPLIVGPIITAVGFALFALPSVGESYWRAFFAPFLVLGFGLAVSVAPLTTVVMGSVDQDHAGSASGINNAVARVAGLLAVAAFGIVMVNTFSTGLDQKAARLGISQQVRGELRANDMRLAGIEIPRGVDSQQVPLVKAAVSDAFIHAFRIVVCCCTALAFMSSLTAGLTIRQKSSQ